MHHPAFPPPKTPLSPRLGSPPFRALPPTAFCTATADGESLSLVNLGGLNSPAAVKEKILARLRIPDDEYFDCVFHLTHIGAGEGRRITDNELWDVCARSGNDRAGVTIFVKRSITFDPESDYAGASSAARLRSQGEDARSLRSASSHHPPVPPAQSMQQSLSAEPRHRPNLPSPSNSSSSIPFMRSPVPPQQNPNRQPPTPPVDPRVHPQYAVVPPSSQYHNLYIQSQYQSHPPPNIRTQTASSAHHMQSFSPVPPRQLMSKSVGNLHGQYTTQDSRPPLPTSGSNSQYRQHDHQSPQSGYPGAYGSRQPPQQPPYPQPPPRQQQTSPRPPTYNPPPPSNQAYPSFDPRVMRAPPSASSSSSRSGPPSSTAPSSSYSPYPSHIPPRSIPTNIPPPSTQFWPGPPPQRPSDRTIRPPEISGRISLRPGEMLQHSGRRASEGQPESIAINSALSRSPPVAAHMRAADPAQEARKRSNANFEAEPGRYATESVPAPRRESSEVRSTMERPSPERSRSKEAATRKRIDGAPPPKVVTNGLGGREGEHAAGNGISGPASASARSSGSSFASNSSTQSFPRRKSAPSDEVYGGMTDDIVSLRTASSTRSSTNSASGPLTPLTPLTDYLSPVLPMTKSPPPSTSALDGLGIEEAKSMPVEIDFGDEEDDTGTWQAGKVPSPYIDSFDEDVEEEGAGTWLVTPKETPSTPSTATLPLKVGGITLKDEPSSRSPTTERNRKEQRPSLRLTIDNSSEISDAAAAVTPRSNGRKSADSDHSTATSSRRIDRARLSPAAAAVVPTPTRPGSLSSIGVGPPPMLRRGTSFARREADSEWAFRPPIETVLENLDEYFPEHDLDQPIVDANTPPTAMRSPAASSPARKDALAESARQGAVTALRNKKTIRKVAQERKRNLQMQKLGNVEEAAAPDLSLLRRKSTKLWGNRVEEVTPEQAKLMSTVITAAPDDDPENFSFKWVKGELIGRGTYGQVYLAMNVTTGDMLAVKQVELPKTRSDQDDLRQQGMVSSLKAEIELLKDLDHSKIVQYLGFEETISHLSIFLEYVPGGSVGRIVRKHGKFEESVTKSFTRQILEGLEYLHSLGILHRDLKADNILCDHVGNCKISDFGTSKKSNDIYNNDANMSMQGSIFWMAPEVVQNWKKGYSAKADIWSLGCICLEMWAGRRPWSEQEAIQAMFKLGAERLAPPIPADVLLTDSSAHFLSECFQIDPELRPTASQLRRHIFLEITPGWDFRNSSLNQALASSRSDENQLPT